MNKKGFELAISTIILMVLGIILLVGLITILLMGWEDFKLQIGAILGSDAAQAQKKCQLQCSLDNKYDFCCEAKKIDKKDFFCYEFADIGCDVQCKEIVCQL